MVSDNVMIAAIQSNMTMQLITLAVAVFVMLVFFGVLSSALNTSKSKKARELFADLYVIGMIRKFAKEDDIDLDSEMKEIRKIEKLENMSNKSLDKAIEDELKEKLQAENQKRIDEINNKKV